MPPFLIPLFYQIYIFFQAIKQLVLISMIFKTFDSDIDKIGSKVGILGKSFDDIFESYQNWKNEIADLSNPLKGGTLTKNQAKQQVGGLFSYIFKYNSKDKLVEEFETFKSMMTDYGMTAEEVAKDLGDQLSPEIQSYVKSAKNGELTTEGFKASIGNLSIGAKAGQVALKGLALAGNMVAGALIGLVLSAIVNGLNDLTHAAENASKAADELYDKSNEKVEKNKEELESLDELIEKYKTLRNSNDTDVNTRKEIQEVQYKIADLVGEQAKNLDLVNGKLDDQLDKLKKIKANKSKKAYDDAVTNYRNSVDASEKAIASGGKSELFGLISENYAYKGEKGGREDEAYNFLIKNGYGKLNNVTTNNSSKIFGSLGSYIIQDGYDETGKELKNAEEKMEFLQKMEDSLTQAGFSDTKMWTGIHTQIQKYGDYIEKEAKAANSMLDAWSNYNTETNKKLTSIDVNSVNKLKEYRSTMIDLMKDDGDIKQALKDGSLTESDILTYVDSYIATNKQFSKWYNL